MKRLLSCILIALLLAACHSSRKTARRPDVPSVEFEKPSEGIDHDVASRLEKEARKWIGTKYRYGGQSRRGTDCSGMMMVIYEGVAGIKLPRDSRSQQKFCRQLKKSQIARGDLVFFATSKNSSRVSHVGMYIGDGDFIHASSSRGVIVSNLSEKYYRNHYHSAGRVPGIKEAGRKGKKKKAERRGDVIESEAPACLPDVRPTAPAPGDGGRDLRKAGSVVELPLDSLLKRGALPDTVASPSVPAVEEHDELADSIRDAVRRAMVF